MKAVDLFCGGGGISAGLRSAGFSVIAGADNDPKYLATFRHNFPDAIGMNVDLVHCAPSQLMNSLSIEPGELDILAGGPPCQGFSKNVPRKLRSADDPNNLLVKRFLDYCEQMRPKAILMENVAEFRNGFARQFSDEIRERLDKAGYKVASAVLNAAEYGVPQKRRRAFFIAVQGASPPTIPAPTHSEPPKRQLGFDSNGFVSVWDAIGDLPSVQHGQGADPCGYACAPFSEYQRARRNGSGKVRNHTARELRPLQRSRLAALQPGQGIKDLPDHLRVKGGYSGAYGRLTKQGVAPTITRWMFHPGSGRWGHPVDTRTLTIREAARIQGFSDDYEFVGSFVQQAGQLGNAAPPLLIERIAAAIRERLNCGGLEVAKLAQRQSENWSAAIAG